MRYPLPIGIVLVALAGSVGAQMPKYGVTVTTDDKADFSKFKSYSWENGWQTYDRAVHANILAAVDRQLASLGLEKRAAAPADLIVTYASLRRIDIDVKSKPSGKDGTRRQYDVGTLVVLLLEPGSRNELFRGRVDKPIELEVDKVNAVVDGAVAEMFAKYPTRQRK